jgi:hypothetical protein
MTLQPLNLLPRSAKAIEGQRESQQDVSASRGVKLRQKPGH